MSAGPRYCTTAEAAEITRHASARTFVQWAHAKAPEVLSRPPGSRHYVVDREKLHRAIWGDLCSSENSTSSRDSS